MNIRILSSEKPDVLTIVSRKSRLAMRQAEYVRSAMHRLYPICDLKILGLTTRGDQIPDYPMSRISGKGLFVKELELALTDGRADLAVHSLKDVPIELSTGLLLAAVMSRDDPRDAFISNDYSSLNTLPAGSIVGTSSLRRQAMLRARYPHLQVQPLRGNIDTRLEKLDHGDYTAIILAASGMKRLGLERRICSLIDVYESIPAVGQAVLAIEIASHRVDVSRWLAPLHDWKTSLAVEAERTVSRLLGGSCNVPLAAYAVWRASELYLRGCVSMLDGTRLILAEAVTTAISVADAVALGCDVSSKLKQQGALDIIRTLTDG
ncbi:MAG: hydroxymethylbilane synthase [Burkholderia sp.]|nr:hydroxymethylbilane synthase [Burkholderia sp.]